MPPLLNIMNLKREPGEGNTTHLQTIHTSSLANSSHKSLSYHLNKSIVSSSKDEIWSSSFLSSFTMSSTGSLLSSSIIFNFLLTQLKVLLILPTTLDKIYAKILGGLYTQKSVLNKKDILNISEYLNSFPLYTLLFSFVSN